MPTHQATITITAAVQADRVESLRVMLEEIGRDAGGNATLPFGQIDGLHFARLVLLDASADLKGEMLAPRLLFLLDCDAPANRRLADIVRTAKDGIDRVFEHCEDYPAAGSRSGRARFDYLRAHICATDVSYVNTVGRPHSQIREEASLRAAIEEFLDEPEHDWSRATAVAVREKVREFVGGRPELAPMLRRAPRASMTWRAGEAWHMVRSLLLVLALTPLGLLVGPFYAALLRWNEKRDPAPRIIPDPEHVERLAAAEDHLAQNQFTAVGLLKPGRFRLYTAIVVLWGVNFGTRHIYNRGALTGVRSIHAARWVFLDGRRRLAFASNYDGSLENYMDDFIDKVSWGLNAVFSNGMEYPRTSWLVRDGAKDELAFKSYIRVRQQPSQVWYSAYGDLTTVNIANNARVRAGLSGRMNDDEAAAWLRLL
ncbi:MAG: hypothetical protein ACSLFM_05315 [Tepidiformaceae bacterium]